MDEKKAESVKKKTGIEEWSVGSTTSLSPVIAPHKI